MGLRLMFARTDDKLVVSEIGLRYQIVSDVNIRANLVISNQLNRQVIRVAFWDFSPGVDRFSHIENYVL